MIWIRCRPTIATQSWSSRLQSSRPIVCGYACKKIENYLLAADTVHEDNKLKGVEKALEEDVPEKRDFYTNIVVLPKPDGMHALKVAEEDLEIASVEFPWQPAREIDPYIGENSVLRTLMSSLGEKDWLKFRQAGSTRAWRVLRREMS